MSAPPPPAPFTGIAWQHLTDYSVGTGWIYLDEIYLDEITLQVFGLRITTWLTRQEPWHTVDPPWHTDAPPLVENQKELHRWNLGRKKGDSCRLHWNNVLSFTLHTDHSLVQAVGWRTIHPHAAPPTDGWQWVGLTVNNCTIYLTNSEPVAQLH